MTRRVIVLGTALLFLSACGTTTIRRDYPRTPSTAFDHPATTSIGAIVEPAAAVHPGASGFTVLSDGRDAFSARLMLADLAERTLDLQYYIWDTDTTGMILAQHLVRAADRGVRVRVLLDDIYQDEEGDITIARLDGHPRIEIRTFNPFANRNARARDMVTDAARINRRMHNKIMVADNAAAIVGGRNIADIYFGVNEDTNFRDLDVGMAGPIVRDVSATFDAFWNSDWAVPAGAFVENAPTDAEVQELIAAMHADVAARGYPYPHDGGREDATAALVEIRDSLTWAPAEVLCDPPEKVGGTWYDGPDAPVREALLRETESLDRELLIEAAYFIPQRDGIATFQELHDRGVHVRVLTNSLASNDVTAAHAGYAKTRRGVLKAGVELYELRPDSMLPKRQAVLSGRSRASLHTKAVVYDRESVFIGSYNIDPRSANINTEIGVLIRSPEIAGEVGAYMDEGVRVENAYHVELVHRRGKRAYLAWVTERDGREVRYRDEPDASFWRRFLVGWIRILPIESQL